MGFQREKIGNLLVAEKNRTPVEGKSLLDNPETMGHSGWRVRW